MPGDKRLILKGGSGSWIVEVGYRGIIITVKVENEGLEVKENIYHITSSGLSINPKNTAYPPKSYPPLHTIIDPSNPIQSLMSKSSSVRYIGYPILNDILDELNLSSEKLESDIINLILSRDLKGVTILKKDELFATCYPGRLRIEGSEFIEEGNFFEVLGEERGANGDETRTYVI